MFVYYLNVPLNQTGVLEFISYAKDMPNVYTLELTDKEYEILRKPDGLFDKFDHSLGTFIDLCEEERIKNEQLDKAIALTKKEASKSQKKDEVMAINKVLLSLMKAKEASTFCEIDIYLV